MSLKVLQAASLRFCIPVAEQLKINKYANFDPNTPCGSRVMSISLIDYMSAVAQW